MCAIVSLCYDRDTESNELMVVRTRTRRQGMEGNVEEALTFGAWLRRRRKALDLTQDALAQRVGYSVVSIRKLESDEQRPSRQLAERLATTLQIPPEQQDLFVRFARQGLDHAPPELPMPTAAALPVRLAEATVPTSRGNLSARLSSFVGRVAERAALAALLRRAEVRLVTLTGPGGTGKTSLALRVAEDLSSDYPDGIWLVDLASIRDPDLVAPTILGVLGGHVIAGVAIIELLIAQVRSRRMLLVLDNFEQVLPAAGVVQSLLHAAPTVCVLATSRAALQIRGEHEYLVAPLMVPHPDEGTATDGMSDALQLFVDRVQAFQPPFRLTDANRATIAAICRALDGLPLAIELAAARIRLFPPEQLAAQIAAHGALTLLSTRGRDLPARQQTMRATIDWSYDLLAPEEQQLFAQLSVFAGGWTMQLAEEVCGLPSDTLLAGLTTLVEQSLVQSTERYSQARFTMLETLRAYGQEQLDRRGAAAIIAERQASAVLALVQTSEPLYLTGVHGPWVAQLHDELHNLRAAMTWSLSARDEAGVGLRIAIGMSEYWGLTDQMSEGFSWFDRLLATPHAISTQLYGHALLVGSMIAENITKLSHAVAWAAESLSVHRALGDVRRVADSLVRLGRCKTWLGQYTEAEAALLEGLDLHRALGDHDQGFWVLQSLGDCAYNHGQHDRAQRWFQEALDLCATNPFGRAWSLTNLGRVAAVRGNLSQAEDYLHEALTTFKLVNPDEQTMDVAHVLLDLGRVAHAQRQESLARARYLMSLDYFATRRPQRVPECLEGLAALASDPATALHGAQLMGAAAALRAAIGVPVPAVQQPSHDRTCTVLRKLLGADAYTAAIVQGQHLSWEQALHLATQT
jgi:predicted ATPase/transcriptional regulator with XRE-family HTH domain